MELNFESLQITEAPDGNVLQSFKWNLQMEMRKIGRTALKESAGKSLKELGMIGVFGSPLHIVACDRGERQEQIGKELVVLVETGHCLLFCHSSFIAFVKNTMHDELDARWLGMSALLDNWLNEPWANY
jgi:hypothetical protein